MLFSAAHPSYAERLPEEMRKEEVHVPPVCDPHEYGALTCPVGTWVSYSTPRGEVTLAVAAREEGHVWIEVVEEGSPRTVSLRKISSNRSVVEAWYLELPAGGIHPQKVSPPASDPGTPTPNGSVERKPAEFPVGDRTLRGVLHQKATLDLDGNSTVEETGWSPEVPLLYEADPQDGGLVRRKGVELLRFGTDWKRLIVPPK